MTTIALASWKNRIAPVFDVARKLRIVESDSGRIVRQFEETLPGYAPSANVHHLAGLGVDTLICGAISTQLEAMAEAYGIRVVSFVAGELDEVTRAWLEGTIVESTFAMPGCGNGRGRQGGGRRRGKTRASSGSGMRRGLSAHHVNAATDQKSPKGDQ
jgi:predicted Fe-Mo cluster-binding NifX family protein